MNTYTSPYEIGIGDNVNYNFMNYQDELMLVSCYLSDLEAA